MPAKNNLNATAESKGSHISGSKHKQRELYIGLMSGTSIDGIDGVLIEIAPDGRLSTLATESLPWNPQMKAILNELCTENSPNDRVKTMGLAGNAVATAEAAVCVLLMEKAKASHTEIRAIGSHGQTIRHHPKLGFSIQLDNGPLLANLTDIDTITNFRAADIANSGEGAPLTQAFHQCVLSSPDCSRFILNLGGIANVTALAPQGKLITAFDTGPANTLLDYVCRTYLNLPYDPDGSFASSGSIDQEALTKLMQHEYLQRPYPKSTGREEFNLHTIEFMLRDLPVYKTKLNEGEQSKAGQNNDQQSDVVQSKTEQNSPELQAHAPSAEEFNDGKSDNTEQLNAAALTVYLESVLVHLAPCHKQRLANVMRTLTEYTVQSCLDAINQLITDHAADFNGRRELVVCGGGALNKFMLQRMQEYANEKNMQLSVMPCTDLGVDPKYLEAQAFAFFAFCCSHAISLNLCSSTHATRPSILGTICPAPQGFYARAMAALDHC